MNKFNVYIKGLARAWPIIIIIVPFLGFFLSNDISLLQLSLSVLIVDKVIGPFLKYVIFKNLLGSKRYPIIGIGKRPNGAKDCGLFLTKKDEFSKTYGMPSGHALTSWFFSSYCINRIFDSNMTNNLKMIGLLLFSLIAIGVMYSRILFNCHTIQQVIFGGIFGIFLGNLYYKHENKIKSIINI